MRPAAVVVAASVVAAVLPWMSGPASAEPQPVTGGGSSFAQLEIEQWRADVARPPYSLKVDYAAAGSTFGRQKFAQGQFDYGVSDIEYQINDNPKPDKPFVYVPISAGGLGFMYNLNGTNGKRITNLRLSQVNVCRAFTEELIYWDDPGIAADNPGAPLPHNPIKRVVRSDGSGTSYVLSEFCMATSPGVWNAFRDYIGTKLPDAASEELRRGLPTSQWPSGYPSSQTAFAADGVADTVANEVTGQNAITYAEAGFAKIRGFPNAVIRNAGGIYTTPDAENVTVALGYAKGRDNGTFQLEYLAPDPRAYFPSTYSYALVQTSGLDAGKGETIATFLYYAACQGQSRAVPLGYARLSTVLVNLAIGKVSQIPGAPAAPDIGQCGAPPPPVIDPNFKPVPPPEVTLGVKGTGKVATGKAITGQAAAGGGAAAAADPAAAAAAAADPVAAEEAAAANQLELESAAGSTEDASAQPQGISMREGMWFLLLGFALVGLGTMTGGGEVLRKRRKGS